VRLGRGQIVIAREEQRAVNGHASEDGFLDRSSALLGAGNLDEQIGPSRDGMKRTRCLGVRCESQAKGGEVSSETQPSGRGSV
jgi:hypothetical protein